VNATDHILHAIASAPGSPRRQRTGRIEAVWELVAQFRGSRTVSTVERSGKGHYRVTLTPSDARLAEPRVVLFQCRSLGNETREKAFALAKTVL